MSIKYQTPPEESLKALQAMAEIMPKTYDRLANMLREVYERPDEHWPHPIYVVGLRAMASEKEGLSGARLAGWRYLVKLEGERNHAVEVQQDADGATHRFSELDKGPFIDGMCRVLQEKGFDEERDASALKLSVVRINTMGVFALWLQADDPNNDRVIAISPTPPYLNPWPETYTVAQFQAALRDEAKRELESEDFFDA
jgi:hypothetical protein